MAQLVSCFRHSQVFVALLSMLALCLTLAFAFPNPPRPGQERGKRPTEIAVEIRQMDREGQVIPVELRCNTAVELKEANELEGLSCVLKNNTGRYITAGTIQTSVTIEKEGKSYVLSNYDTFDTFLHPDFRQEHGANLIPPGGEYPLGEIPVAFEDSSVRGVAVQIDYIEFADKTTAGDNQRGSRIVSDIREGAAKYKDWLSKKYNQKGKSLDVLLSLMDDEQPLPLDEVGISNANQQHGATLYMRYARNTYNSKGAEALIKHFKHPRPSAN